MQGQSAGEHEQTAKVRAEWMRLMGIPEDEIARLCQFDPESPLVLADEQCEWEAAKRLQVALPSYESLLVQRQKFMEQVRQDAKTILKDVKGDAETVVTEKAREDRAIFDLTLLWAAVLGFACLGSLFGDGGAVIGGNAGLVAWLLLMYWPRSPHRGT